MEVSPDRGDGIGTMMGFFPNPPVGEASSWFTLPSFYGGNDDLIDYTPEAGFTLEWRIKVLTAGNGGDQKIGVSLNTVKPAGRRPGRALWVSGKFH